VFRKKNTVSVLPIDAEDSALVASINWTSLQEKVAKGDLSVRVSVTSTATPAMVAFNTVMDHYEHDIMALTHSLNQAINSSAKQNNRLHELADDSKKLSNGMQRIAAAVEELSSSIEEIAGSANQLNEQIHSFEEVASTSSMKVRKQP
jgi:methyl-accepting chemotaxis protein